MGKSRGADYDRKFDEWEWYDKTLVKERLKFEVRYRAAQNVARKPPFFYIDSTNPVFHVEDGDLTKLHAKMDEAIRKSFQRAWSKFFLVKYNSDQDAGSASLTLNVLVYEIASDNSYRRVRDETFDPDDGEGTPWEYNVRSTSKTAEEAIINDNKKYGDDEAQFALLPATPTMFAALTSLKDGVTKIAAKLNDLLSPKNVNETMKTLAFNRLLPNKR